MRRDEEYFEESELVLVYIAKKLKEALAVEQLLTTAEFDYLVEPDKYVGGVIFRSERVGAFFYVAEREHGRVQEYLSANGYHWQPS